VSQAHIVLMASSERHTPGTGRDHLSGPNVIGRIAFCILSPIDELAAPMRPGPDGPAKILAAIRVAASSCARRKLPLARGAMQQQECSNRADIH
jgi:hypothetical protein